MKIKQKAQQIQYRIDKLKKKSHNEQRNKKSYNLVFSIAVELVAGIIAGLFVGFMLDKMFATAPLFIIICMIFAMFAAFKAIWHKNFKGNNSNEA